MVSWLHTQRSAITFDVGSAGLRACQLTGRGTAPGLQDLLLLDLMPTPEGESLPAPQPDPALVARAVGQGRFSGTDVALILSPPDVQFFPLRLPDRALAQEPEKLQQALRWEVAQETRGAADELEVRAWPLPRGRGQNTNIMAVATSAKTAAAWCDQLAAHGLHVRRIDVSPCALVRLATLAWTPAEHELWGVLDLGLRHATLTVVVGTTPAYVRTLTHGAHHWTCKLAKTFEVSYAVAEQLKREHALAPTERGFRPGPGAQNLLQSPELGGVLTNVLRDALQALAAQVGRCFSYVMQGFPDQTVSRLLLAGGGAALGGLAPLLEAELGIPVAQLTEAQAEPPTRSARPKLDLRAAAVYGGALLDLEAA